MAARLPAHGEAAMDAVEGQRIRIDGAVCPCSRDARWPGPIYPADNFDARVRSWVRAADARLDPVLARAVSDWLADAWPFEHVDDAGRTVG